MEWSVDPALFLTSGGFELRWYSVFFAGGFLLGFIMVQRMFAAEGKSQQHLDYILMVLVIGTLVGARLGHCLIYEPDVYLTNPLRILNIREGGLASHGGFAGIILAVVWYTRRNRELPFFWLADRLAIPTLFEAGLIRLGNFFNSEIYGYPTDVPWAITFIKSDPLPRHPTQLYELVGYWAIGVFCYWYYRREKRQPGEGRILGIALASSFAWRMFVEFFKENQVAFEDAMFLNLGQLLSIPFIFLGIWIAMGGPRKVGALKWGYSSGTTDIATEVPSKQNKGKGKRRR